MKESSRHNNEKNTDPTKFSPISENLGLKLSDKTHPEKYKPNKETPAIPVEIPIWTDANGDEYFQKMPELKPDKQDLPAEHFISMLVKGVLNSSDLIKHGDIYLSKKMDLTKIEKGTHEEITAEIFLLHYLFEEMDKTSIKQNVQIDPETGSFAHYDYSEAFRSKNDDPTFWYKTNQKAEELISDINIELNNIDEYKRAPKGRQMLPERKSPSREVELAVLKRSFLLKDQIQNWEFFKSVVKKSSIDLSSPRFHFLSSDSEEERAKELQRKILERLEVLIKVLEDRNNI